MTNDFETGTRKVIPAVLLYAFFDHQLLMIHRNMKANDFHEGKWNGLGGKLEAGESFTHAAVREFLEESGVVTQTDEWHWLGQLHFPNFKPSRSEDWWVNVFFVQLSEEQAALVKSEKSNSEGTLHWIPVDQILSLNLWDGDRYFLPYVLERKPFQGTFIYENGSCVRHEITAIQTR